MNIKSTVERKSPLILHPPTLSARHTGAGPQIHVLTFDQNKKSAVENHSVFRVPVRLLFFYFAADFPSPPAIRHMAI